MDKHCRICHNTSCSNHGKNISFLGDGWKCNYIPVPTNADRIRAMSDEELAEFLTHINPTNCQDCAFCRGWRCQSDRDDYSDFEKCEEGRKRWLQQPAEEEDHAICGTTNLPCIRCNPGGCDNRKEGAD